LCGCRQGKYEEALVDFETVLGSKPTDREEAVASYNVACCYSKLGNVSQFARWIQGSANFSEMLAYIRLPRISVGLDVIYELFVGHIGANGRFFSIFVSVQAG
jgi:hypothetical protein